MAKPTPRFTINVNQFDEQYDRTLLVELLECVQHRVSHGARTPTFLYQLSIVIDLIMRRREVGTLEPYWRENLCFGRNSCMGSFLVNNFPKDHRIWNYISVDKYSVHWATAPQ